MTGVDGDDTHRKTFEVPVGSSPSFARNPTTPASQDSGSLYAGVYDVERADAPTH